MSRPQAALPASWKNVGMESVRVHRLRDAHRAAIRAHLLRLGDQDRRYRFGQCRSDEAIAAYAEGLDFIAAVAFGMFAPRGDLVCLLQAFPYSVGPTRHVEAAFSTDLAWRRQGLAGAAFGALEEWCFAAHIERIVVHCGARNMPMRTLLLSVGATVCVTDGEAEAFLDVQQPHAPEHGRALPPSEPLMHETPLAAMAS